jgi:hypothetical protein
MKNILVLIVLAGLAWFGYGKFKSGTLSPTEVHASTVAYPPPAPTETAGDVSPAFSCDGRTMCSQMTSCAEATYFIQHCPNTKMDGNNDGEPCERQWCN